jgi:nucleoside-diphosphate-sugar epimerase
MGFNLEAGGYFDFRDEPALAAGGSGFDNRGHLYRQSATMEPSQAIVAVTGAGGFLGHSLCKRLIDQKFPVRALVRYRSDLPGEYQFDLGNQILDPAALTGPVQAVVHCAWDIKPRSLAESRRINLEGTQWLAEQCKKAAVKQFVFLSCLSAATHSVFGQTKSEVERKLLADWRPAALITVISPGVVIGDGGLFAMARTAIKSHGKLPIFCGGESKRLPIISVDDLCDAIISCITKQVPGRLSVANPQSVALKEFLTALGTLEHKKLWLLPIPIPRLLPAEAWKRLTVGTIKPADIQESLRLLGQPPLKDFRAAIQNLTAKRERVSEAL